MWRSVSDYIGGCLCRRRLRFLTVLVGEVLYRPLYDES
jgi:hypothetical protein